MPAKAFVCYVIMQNYSLSLTFWRRLHDVEKSVDFGLERPGFQSWLKVLAAIFTSESESVSRSVVSNSLLPHGPLSMEFSRQEYWSGLPFPARLLCPWNSPWRRQGYWSGLLCPPPGDLPNPGINPASHVSCICRQVPYR